MRLVALGSPLELWDDNQQQTDLGSAKSRGVLSVLLYARGAPVASPKLVDRVWGDEPPAKPQESLNPLISRLRSVLSHAVGDRAAIKRRASGLYQLLLEDEQCVDLWCFQRLRTDAVAAAARGDRELAVGRLHTAETLWRGEPFAELPSEWAASVRARLEEEHRRVREERIRLELELGRHADLIGELHEMAAEYPLAQRQIGALMTALDHTGRTDEALAVYRDLRQRLRESQGIEPGAELQSLHSRLLQGKGAPGGAGAEIRRPPAAGTGHHDPAHGAPVTHGGVTAVPASTVGTTSSSAAADAPVAADASDAADAAAPSHRHAAPVPARSAQLADPPQPVDSAHPPQPAHPTHPGSADQGQGPRGAATGPNSLPRDVRDFTGRDSELALLTGPPRDARSALPLTVVHGMAGVGKTALVVHAAHRLATEYPDGAFYVDLRGYSEQQRPCEPAEALGILLRAVGATDPAQEDAQSASQEVRSGRWREWTARRRALLVLDNAKEAAQVRPLLPGAATCRALVTSRSRLSALEGADFVFLDVLPMGEAAALFTRVAGDTRVPDVAQVRRVVGAYGGHALSLQILASGFRHRESWDLGHLAEHVERAADPLDALEGDAVGSAFRLSYTALEAPARRLFRRLALHPGPDLDLGAARALAGGDGGPALGRTLSTLLDHHLLEEPVRERFALHDLAAAFARRACLAEESAGDRQEALDRLRAHHLTAADRADRLAHPRRRRIALPPELESPCAPHFADADEAAVWLAVERPNLLALARAAAGSPAYAALFPHVLAPSLRLWGAWDVAAELHAAAETVLREHGRREMLAQTLVEHADVLVQDAHAEALHRAREAYELFEGVRDDHGRAHACFQTGRAHCAAGRFPDALRALGRALALSRADGDSALEAGVLNVRGVVLHKVGRQREAREQFLAMLAIHTATEDLYGQMRAINNLGEMCRHEARNREAREHFERSLELAQVVGGRREKANLHNNLGMVCQAMGETDRALVHLRSALDGYRADHDPRGEADTLSGLGALFAVNGRYSEALWHYSLAESVACRIEAPCERQAALIGTGTARKALGRYEEALAAFHEALESARSVGAPWEAAQALDGIARTLLLTQGASFANGFAKDALRLYERLGHLEQARALRRHVKEPAEPVEPAERSESGEPVEPAEPVEPVEPGRTGV